jgi:hypothetical protein
MSMNKFFPKVVKSILPFAPVVGVVSTCLLVASAIAQVADPIKNAGMALQVSADYAVPFELLCKLPHISFNFFATTDSSVDAPLAGWTCWLCSSSLLWI